MRNNANAVDVPWIRAKVVTECVINDCMTGETERQKREKQMERMVRATDWAQMEMEEFISVKN